MKRAAALILALVLCLGLCSVAASADGTISAEITVTYNQSMAREVLTYVNEFRASDDAWYWNSDNTTTTTLTDLAAYTYDYDLEAAAMQRAAELAISFSHTRPDGTSWDTAGSMSAENIAAGYTSASAVFTGWAEADADYSGQGHRRAMLGNYTSIGIGCVYYNGTYYWAMEFGYSAGGTATDAVNSSQTVSVNISSSQISSVNSLTASETSVTVTEGNTASVPTITANLTCVDAWPGAVTVTLIPSWTVTDTTVAMINDSGVLEGVKAGTTTMTASVALDQTYDVSADVTVEHAGLVTEAGKAATCTEDGYTDSMYCSYCDEVIQTQEVIPATGHTAVTDAAVAATCTETGLTEGSHCSVCGEVLTAQEVIPATGHNAVKVEAVAATETTAGNIEYWYCASCDTYFADEALTTEISQDDTVVAALGTATDPTETEPTTTATSAPAATATATPAVTAVAPATGDNSALALWVTLTALCALGVAAVISALRKKEN